MGESQSRQANGAGAAPGLGILDFRLIAGRMGYGPANMDSRIISVNVRALQPQHFLKTEGVQGLYRQICPV